MTLPADGTYHLHVQAPAAQASSTGNYVITAYNATVNTAPLNLNQTTTGTIDTPFRIDRWTFAATAGQLVQFNLVNVSNPAVVFDLTGPAGYTAFSGDSEFQCLPPTELRYLYPDGPHGPEADRHLCFPLVESAPTALVLGTPQSEPLAGKRAEAVLYRHHHQSHRSQHPGNGFQRPGSERSVRLCR